ncbi:nuclear transport factor 2 family protein [Pseudomonas sp. GOM7]|uniref:nuclear transport factor 2 family protein n=1 Tax=Pseudomonas sp. GOM7 TaxID=2998079 RepID=UPI00227B9992|nr:nuclear transport factor 2 family protein [Pseudomonas sp. GOM7]WAJ39215.1 nuclear transport factor 2 family protein [Pseudomonas sp. GOM7]
MNLHLPEAVNTYFAISNGGDATRLATCFHAHARVTDEKRTHQGIDAIVAWQREARQAFSYRVEPVDASQRDEALTVTARVTGDFPGSPVLLKHLFALTDGRISSLEIAP